MSQLLTSDTIFRALTILMLMSRDLYWNITESRANVEKPRLRQRSWIEYLKRNVSLLAGIVIYLQLLGLQIVPFASTTGIQSLGLAMVAIGFSISMLARKNLGANWAHGAEYQIKHGHTLTTNGIYKYTRHPIYTGILLGMIGAEIVAGSLIFWLLLIVLPIAAVIQGKKEERILIEKFGDEYVSYMNRTKMLIPYIF
jgi:protein-S-isoprenylcysteine O-methyltransferase Ste14